MKITQRRAFIKTIAFGSLVTNKEAYKKINTTFTQPAKTKEIWMIFRLGYSKTPTSSFRLETKNYIINS